jgi:predicted metal-dependent enzyme (double-stranded beta helix superfamily)
MKRLIAAVRGAVRLEADPADTAAGVASVLQRFLGRPDLLTQSQSEPDSTHYRQHIIHVERDGSFSIVALVWLPGQETPIHDHVSWCVVGVHEGRENEIRYRLVENSDSPHLVEDGNVSHDVGTVEALTSPGDIHLAANHGDDVAISLHIYGADIGVLGSSIRRRYHLPVMSSAASQDDLV